MKHMGESMMALVCREGGALSLEERPVPQLQGDRDAVVKVTLSTICTSDLHIRRGAVPRAVPGTVLGHEFVGVVTQAGARTGLHPGDRVAANCITFCGECWFCRHGYINNCERGGWELGCRIDGCQAEFVRVPFADQGLTRIPDGVTDENALFLGDILASGYFGAELLGIRPGDTVAVIGAGPVGLCAMACARLFGAAQIVALDLDENRLEVAQRQGLSDAVVHPGKEDAPAAVRQMTPHRGADGVVEAAGGTDTFQLAWQLARPTHSGFGGHVRTGSVPTSARHVREKPDLPHRWSGRGPRETADGVAGGGKAEHRFPHHPPGAPQRYSGGVPRV